MSMINPLEISPEWRSKLLPQIVDYRAATTPNLPYAEYPISPTAYDQGFSKFNYRDLANAINGIAWWLQRTMGPGKFEALAYIGPNDIRVPALILGAVKVGYVIFLISPRNSLPAQFHLLAETQCTSMLFANPQAPAVTAILESPNHNLRSFEIPSVKELVEEVQPHFPYEKNYKDDSSDPICIVHTSGSTGMPKTLVVKHIAAMGNAALMGKEAPPDFHNLCRFWQGNKVFAVFPPFHAMYLGAFLFNSVTFGTVMVTPLATAIPTAGGILEALKYTHFDAAFILPSMVQELGQNPVLLDSCAKHLKSIFFAGGDLPQEIGNVVASKILLANHYGSTESGLLSLLVPKDDTKRDREDWKYLRFDDHLGLEFRQFNDKEFELYIKRDPTIAEYQPVFGYFPDASEFRTRDLFLRHPSKKDLWKWCARADDIIVLVTGEKTNPISMEQHILSENSDILGVLVAGAQRFQTALLIHPLQDLPTLSQKAAFIEKIWPSIEEANQVCPSHARIVKSHILFTIPSKPMLLSGKGTIQRAATLKLYASEFDKLYEDADKITSHTKSKVGAIDLVPANLEKISDYTKQAICSITNSQNFGDDDNFVLLGMDSLQALTIVRQLREDLSLPSISTSTIYTNPSVSALSKALIELYKRQKTSDASAKESRTRIKEDIITEYQHLIDLIPVASPIVNTSTDKYVVLTGTTGSIGSHILDSLLKDPTVVHVYCVNRGTDIADRQLRKNRSFGLQTAFPTSQITFVSADLSSPSFGLESSIYEELKLKATHVIHNAWPVNFTLDVQAFRPQLTGLLNLIAFAATTKFNLDLMFISSMGALIDSDNPTGYAESKRISEILLTYAFQHLSKTFSSTTPSLSIVRVGQISGPVNHPGQWNVAEWFPSIILSSMHLGVIPNTLGTVLGKTNWIPVDIIGPIIVELAFTEKEKSNITLFHPSNQHLTTYESLLPTIISKISQSTNTTKKLVPIPPDEWVRKVRDDIVTGSNSKLEPEILLNQNPAARLLDFYNDMFLTQKKISLQEEHLKEVETGRARTLKMSKQLQELGPVKEDWVNKWVGEWMSDVGSGSGD